MGKLTECDDQGNWSLKGVKWKDLYVGMPITREIQEKLNGRTNRGRHVSGNGVVCAKTQECAVECRRKPGREADQRQCEDDVDRQRYGNVCAGVERFFFVDEKCDDLCRYVRYVECNKVAEAAVLYRVVKHKPVKCFVVHFLDLRDQRDQVDQCKLYDAGQKAYHNEFDKLPKRFDAGAFFFRHVVDVC